MRCNFQKTVCVQHTRTYKLTRTHTRSLKRNEDKGLWRPWLAVLFVKVELTFLHMHAHKRSGPRARLQRRTESRKQRGKRKSDGQGRKLFLMPTSQSDCCTQSLPSNYTFELDKISNWWFIICHSGWRCGQTNPPRQKCDQHLGWQLVFVPSPVTRSEGRRDREEVLRALPHTHSQTPSKEHVQQVLHFVCDLEAEAFADHHVPRTAEFLVHWLLDHLRCTLRKTARTKREKLYV